MNNELIVGMPKLAKMCMLYFDNGEGGSPAPAPGTRRCAPMEGREIEKVQILKGDVTVSYRQTGEFEIPSRARQKYNLYFDREYTIRETDWDEDFSCEYRVENRLFQDCSFVEGDTIRKFSDGFELRRHPDGWEYLYIYRQIPTFDEHDEKWGSSLDAAIYRDGDHINLIACTSGDQIANVKVFLNMQYPERSSLHYLEYLKEE